MGFRIRVKFDVLYYVYYTYVYVNFIKNKCLFSLTSFFRGNVQ